MARHPFGTVFLNRILEKALMESGQNPAARFLAGELLDFLPSSSASMMEMRWSTPRRCRCSPDLLKEEYLVGGIRRGRR